MNQQPASSNDGATIFFTLMIVAGLWAIWHFFHQQITNAIGSVRHGELWLILQFVSPATAHRLLITDWYNYLGNPRARLSFDDIRNTSPLTGHFLRYPATVLLALMAYVTLFRAPGSGPKNAYSLDRLIKAQSRTWPVITPITNFNPATSNARDPDGHDPLPAELPLFAEALSPDEWLRFHRIAPYDSVEHERSSHPLDRDATIQAFAEQLGGRWRDAASLPWDARCLFAVFALKSARKRDEADELLGRLAVAANPRHGMALDLSAGLKRDIMKIVNDPKLGGEAAKITRKHAFVATALLGLLMHARTRGGVLAPAQFVWLRGAHRALWYPLNNLGRHSFHTEAAGAMAHFQAEIMAGTPLFSPKVGTAVDTLEEFVNKKSRGLPALVD